MWGKYNAGIAWKYYTDQQVVGGVGAELEYQMRGYRIFEGQVSDSTIYNAKTRTVNSVTVPLMWQPHLYMMNRKVRGFLNAAVTLSYNMGAGDNITVTNYRFDSEGNRTITSTTEPYTMQLARDVRWNYGVMGGAGFGVLLGRFEIVAEGRYYFGMSDVLRTRTKYMFNEQQTIRSEIDNLFITVGVFFRLGKGGITEQPLGKRKVVPPSGDDFRNLILPF